MRFQGAFRCCGLMYWACRRRPHDLDVLNDEICSLWFVAGASRAVLFYERVVPFIQHWTKGTAEELKARGKSRAPAERQVVPPGACSLRLLISAPSWLPVSEEAFRDDIEEGRVLDPELSRLHNPDEFRRDNSYRIARSALFSAAEVMHTSTKLDSIKQHILSSAML